MAVLLKNKEVRYRQVPRGEIEMHPLSVISIYGYVGGRQI